MSLQDIFFGALQAQLPDPKPAEADIRQLAQTIAERIEGETGATSLPISFVEGEIKQQAPIIQLMLAQDHSSIHNAAQHVVQVFTEDPRSIIPEAFRGEAFCPYPGLAAFDEGDARYFYGRSDDIEAFVGRLPRPLIALTGPSGVGKSSFMAAGVLPALRARYGETAVYLTFRVHANANLLDDFAAFLSEETEETAVSIAQALRQREDGLLTLLQTTFGGGSKQVFLFLDQFESLFVGEEENRARDRNCLLENLLYVEDNQQEPFLTVLLASRENFFEHSDYTSRARLAEIIQRENVSLFALSNVQLRQAIEQPLARFNQDNELTLRFQSGLVDLIVRDFRRNTAVSLPLVQYLLRLLWVEKYHLTHFAYNSLGGLEQVLDRHALAIYQSFADEDQRLVKAILLSLVRPGISGEHTRKRIRRESLLVNQEGNTQQRIEQLLRRLSDARSRIISEQQVGQTAYLELTHEIILRQWTLLQEIIETHKERIAIRERLLPKAEAWLKSIEINGRKGDKGELYSGNELRQARQYLEAAPYGGNVDGTIIACFAASQSHRRKVFIRNAAFIIVVIILVTGLVLWIQDQADQQITSEQQRADANATEKAIAEQQRDTRVFEAENSQATAEAVAESEKLVSETQRDVANYQQKVRLAQSLAVVAPSTIEGQDIELATLLAIEAANINREVGTSSGWLQDATLRTLLTTTPYSNSVLRGHRSTVWTVAFSPDGQTLASSGGGLPITADRTIRLWNLVEPNAESVRLTGHESFVRSVTFSPDGQTLASGSDDGTVRLWNLKDPAADPVVLFGHASTVWSVTFSPDSQTLASGNNNGTLHLWDLGDPDADPIVLSGHESFVYSVAFSPNGQTLASGSDDSTIRLWDLDNLDANPVVLSGHESFVYSVAFSPDGQTLASGSHDRTARLWSLSNLSAAPVILSGHDSIVWSVAFSPDSQTLASGSDDQTIRLWNLVEPTSQPSILRGHEESVRAVAFSPDGRSLASGSDDTTVRLWQLAKPSAQPIALHGHQAGVESLAFSSDGRTLASGSYDHTIRLWKLSEIAGKLGGESSQVLGSYSSVSVAFFPNSQMLASNNIVYDTILLWDLADSTPEPTPRDVWGAVGPFAFAPNGQTLAASASDGTIRLWSLADPIAAPIDLVGHEDLGNSAVVFSPDSQMLASGSDDGAIRLWHLADLATPPIILGGHTSFIGSVAFSPNGQMLASGSDDSTIRLWNLADLTREPIVLRGHGLRVNSIAFSPDSQILASGSDDMTIRLWKLADLSAEPTILRGHEANVLSIAFSPDGQTLASGSGDFFNSMDNTVRLWVLLDRLVEIGCHEVRRNMTLDEWQRYLPGEPYRQTCSNWPPHPSAVNDSDSRRENCC